MTWVAVGVGAGTAVAGIAGSQSAANAQESAANKANRLITAFKMKQDQSMNPYVQTGYAGNQLLNTYMGIDTPMLTREQIYAQLAPKYTAYQKVKNKSWTEKALRNPLALGGDAGGMAGIAFGGDVSEATFGIKRGKQYNKIVNQKGLNKAVDAYMAKQQAEYDARHSNPAFGLLTKKFTNEDFVKDPGYEFRRQQGETGVNRNLASRGGYFSGAAMKELNQYNQDYASNEFNQAAARDAQYKANLFNRLASMAGGGRQLAYDLSNAGMGAAGQYGANQMAGAQAAGAGTMGSINALTSGLGQGYNMWQGQQYLNSLNKQKPVA